MADMSTSTKNRPVLAADRQLFSLGHMAAELGLALPVLTEAMAEIVETPAWSINGVLYYDGSSYGRLFCHLVNTRAIENLQLQFTAAPVEWIEDEEDDEEEA